MNRLSIVCMAVTTLSDYESTMHMVMAHTTIASRVRNDYNLPKADNAAVTASASVRNGVKLYQANDFGIERDDNLTS